MPITLTRILVNRHHPAARKDLLDYNGLHKTLMRLLPHPNGPHPRKTGGLLFRLDGGLDPVLLVQTAATPHLTGLPHGYGDMATTDLTPMFDALTPGLHVHYRITAAPVVSRSAGPSGSPSTRQRGKLVPLTGADARAWWQRRAQQCGLHLTNRPETTSRPFHSPHRPGPHEVLTRFDGTATVTDPAALTTALTDGIGRGKSYGAGLLTLRPA